VRLSDIERPQDLYRIIEHRFVRHGWWSRVLAARLRRLPDARFISLLNEAGTVDEIVGRLHEQLRLRFFFHPRNRKDFFLNTLTTTQPYESILEEARLVLNNSFQTLGSGIVELGDRIRWQRDFKSGIEWDLAPTNELDLEDRGRPSDVKVPWELSRFHQNWWLGKAYWLTHSEEYAEKFRSLADDWIEQNPPGLGVNWANGMEASIRAVNWMAGYYFFCESSTIPAAFWLKFFKSLYVHGVFIENNLEYSVRNHNHLLADLVGLTFLGIFFRQTPFGKRWLEKGMRGLEEEMANQVYPDGVDYEKSTSYHRLVLEFFTSAAILGKHNGLRWSDDFLRRLGKMFDFVLAYSRPDGSIPLYGDADDGRLFRLFLKDEINDHRHMLAVGAVLFDRSDLKIAAGKFHQHVLWLFGGEGFERWQLLRAEAAKTGSRAFPGGGFYILQSADTHVTVDAGDIGLRGRGGHGHNDVLSFEFWHRGHPLIVDSGTYGYTFDIEARQEFRRTRSHNTIVVDGQEQAPFDGLWAIRVDNSRPKVTKWNIEGETIELEVEHDAYSHLNVIHRRSFQLEPASGKLRIVDDLKGTGEHLLESYLHFAPDVVVSLESGRRAVAAQGNLRYALTCSAGAWEIAESWFSPSYGLRFRNKTLRLSLKVQLPARMEIVIEPSEVG